MVHEYRAPHHLEDQNAVTEVRVPEPHQRGCRPPRADALVTEADAFYEGLGMGAYFSSVFEGTPEQGKRGQNTVGPDECGPDRRGCGCQSEPAE